MKQILGFSFLLGLIFLGGCTTTNKISQDDLFQKKQQCAKQENEIQKEIEEANQLYKQGKYFTHQEKLSEIFYSPQKNSCLYSVDVIEEQEGTTCAFFKIYDFFSKEMEEIYLEQDLERNCNYQESERKFKQALKELKGE